METTIGQAIDLFIATKESEGRSDRTTDWYRRNLLRFAEHLDNGTDTRIHRVDVEDARSFVSSLRGRTSRYENHPHSPQKDGGLSPSTIHGYVRTLKVFGTWLQEEGITQYNSFQRLKRPKLPQSVIRILTEQEIAALVDRINPNCFLGSRQYAIVLLFLDTGIRAGELCGLTLENTFLDENKLLVHGKGDKERIVPFANGTKKALIRYLTVWRPEPLDPMTDSVFLSVDGSPLSYNGLSQTVKKLGIKAGIPRLHPHLFRHTFAVHYLMNGGDVMSLKRILGHTTLDVTQTYIHLAEEHVRVQHHRYSPVDRLGIGTRRRRKK